MTSGPFSPAAVAVYVGCAQPLHRPVFTGVDMGCGPDMTATFTVTGTFTPYYGGENEVVSAEVSPEEGSVGGRPLQPLHIRGCL